MKQEEEENRAIFGDPAGQGPKPRRRRRAEMWRKVKEYQQRFPRNCTVFREETQQSILERVRRKFQKSILDRVTEVLGRPDGAHRDKEDLTVVPEFCSRCGCQHRSKFYRDGYWTRSLMTRWGKVKLRIPQVVCDCGGSVSIAYPQFAPWQRRFEDMQEEILGLSALCLSLRQIRMVLAMHGTRLSIATLCKEVGRVGDLSKAEFKRKSEVPPVVVLDGIWGNLAHKTGAKFIDKRGRERERKEVEKVPLLVAWGVWPDSGKKALLGWVVGKEEDTASWQKLLEMLHTRGLHADKGLRLFVGDGSQGLRAALAMVSFGRVAYQRCVFHKMRNVLREVKGDGTGADAKEKREQRKKRREAVLADLVVIWQADSEGEARQRYEAFIAKWEAREREAVQRLKSDFAATLVFYGIQAAAAARGERWEARYLRTTSALERVNRNIRAKLRAASIFQTENGLCANVYLALGARGKQDPTEFAEWIQTIAVRSEHLQLAA